MSDDAHAYYGFLNINKPTGMTSHDVVARVRRILRAATGSKKVGHAGTLDPMATGVLVLCLQQATRLSEYAMRSTKVYRAEVHFGITTDSYDAEGAITAERDASHLTQAEVEAALLPFIGDIDQVPPMYSAIKKDGKKLYELARQGKSVEVEARPVTIHHIVLVRWQAPKATLLVTCSPGTYIRSLAYDLGEQLGVGAHLSGLVRERSGGFNLANAVSLDDLLEDEDWQRHIISPEVAFADEPALHLSEEAWQDVLYGRFLPRESDDLPEEIFAYTPAGQLGAILCQRGQNWKPHKVLLPQE
ncbi:tRNA pseudouridine(55) synthase TruB [Phototrophicus methaneseepsis]|uniref:tRNA pseudouridine synthase B n=1 Tax=Phototrophicus methaneseepsis TaxID=2710758 RepID=A0A7S8E735_9CHLR|nr:tRNA pseudouridine(55) synthase TruB [Phototrophicus methaneseepsis]QPC81566.1 tRNA pseudouridine(55) synthase TruB [Phototrophicus methaneseepsis]